MELMFILKLLTPHWLGLGLCSCETPANLLFSLCPFLCCPFPPSFLFRYSHFLSILLCPSLLSVNYLKSHCDVPQHVFSHTGSVTQGIVCPSRHWLNYPNNYLVDCNLWRTRGADFLILPPSRQIPSSETGQEGFPSSYVHKLILSRWREIC